MGATEGAHGQVGVMQWIVENFYWYSYAVLAMEFAWERIRWSL